MLFMVLLLWLYVSCASVIYIECSGVCARISIDGYEPHDDVVGPHLEKLNEMEVCKCFKYPMST